MTPTEFRHARRELGLSVRQFAEMLGVEPEAVRRMEIQFGEGGHRPIRGSIERLIRAYLDGYRPPDWPAKVLLAELDAC
jgi:transcriptional regulator with XRE-family HTH domain